MSEYDADILAAEYILGVLDAEQSRRFEQRLEQEPALRAEVARWEALLGGFETATEEAPPAEAWTRLAQALDREETAVPFHTVPLAGWRLGADRTRRREKFLYRDSMTGTESSLYRLQPGACIEAHRHAKAEECLVLQGDLTIGDLRLNAGDYHVAGKGTIHPVLRSQSGTVLFVRGAIA
jgi:anti-sigma factor ChrR (cupin superfamily)